MPPLPTGNRLFALLAACAVSGASAHMIMRKPVPYNYAGTKPLIQVNPLGAAEYPFPGQGLNKVVEMANYTAGTPAEVSFTGAAVHGGGSCQFAIAYHDDSVDPATLKDPKAWRVLASVIGGCPGEAVGNLEHHTGKDGDERIEAKVCADFAEKECSKSFKIPLPKELPNGRASFAWTWFNKIGNREMYMNTAPVTISGGSDQAAGNKYLDNLPPLFIANIAGDPLSTCETKEGILGFPNPGKTGMVIQDAVAASSGTCEAPKALKPEFENDITQLNHGGGGGPGAGNSSSPLPPYAGPTNSAPGGAFPTVPSVPTTLVTSTTKPAGGADDDSMTTTVTTIVHETVYVTLPGTSVTSYVTGPGGGGAASGTPAPPVSVACKAGDVMICIGSTHFGLCNRGSAIPQPVAAGTVCSGNRIVHAEV